MLTKAIFLREYRKSVEGYAWSADSASVERFMTAVTDTLYSRGTPWRWDSKHTEEIYKKHGGVGRVTLKALRALPE